MLTALRQIETANADRSDEPVSGEIEVAASFSALEWLVIAIARRDSMSSIRQPGRIALALGTLFGTAVAPALADPRLEELRYAAVLAWHQREPDSAEWRRFLDAGFRPDHIALLRASIARDLGTDARHGGTSSVDEGFPALDQAA